MTGNQDRLRNFQKTFIILQYTYRYAQIIHISENSVQVRPHSAICTYGFPNIQQGVPTVNMVISV